MGTNAVGKQGLGITEHHRWSFADGPEKRKMVHVVEEGRKVEEEQKINKVVAMDA